MHDGSSTRKDSLPADMKPSTPTRAVSRGAPIRVTTPWMRWFLLIASGLVFTVGITLVLLPAQTDRYFAWTIDQHLTAGFLGAAYWASGVLEVSASRETVWARTRVGIPTVFAFTALTLITTLLHIDRFHLGGEHALSTRLGTWVWLAVYSVVPPGMLILWLVQARVRGDDPPRYLPLAHWVRALIILQGSSMLLLGVTLFVAPATVAWLWPWTMGALSARAIAAWSIGLSVGVLHVAYENDWWRVQSAAIGYTVFAILELIMLLRFAGEVEWASPRIWLYVAFLLSILLVGVYGYMAGQRAIHRPRST